MSSACGGLSTAVPRLDDLRLFLEAWSARCAATPTENVFSRRLPFEEHNSDGQKWSGSGDIDAGRAGAHVHIHVRKKLMHVFWDVWDGVPCGLWWKSVLGNRVLAPQNTNFLPAAQPWWTAGCAVRGVGGQGGGDLYTKMRSRGVRRGVWARTN